MRRQIVRACLRLAIVAILMIDAPAHSQYVVRGNPGYRVYAPRSRGTYGPRMSFGEFGARLNYSEAFGSPMAAWGASIMGSDTASGRAIRRVARRSTARPTMFRARTR